MYEMCKIGVHSLHVLMLRTPQKGFRPTWRPGQDCNRTIRRISRTTCASKHNLKFKSDQGWWDKTMVRIATEKFGHQQSMVYISVSQSRSTGKP